MRVVLSVDGGPVSVGGDTVDSDEGVQAVSTQPWGAPMPTVYVPGVLLPNRCVCEDHERGRVEDLSSTQNCVPLPVGPVPSCIDLCVCEQVPVPQRGRAGPDAASCPVAAPVRCFWSSQV